jgi:hypothetical protein
MARDSRDKQLNQKFRQIYRLKKEATSSKSL